MTLWTLYSRISVKNPQQLLLWVGEDVRVGIILFDHLRQNFLLKDHESCLTQEDDDGTKVFFYDYDAYFILAPIEANNPERVHEHMRLSSLWSKS